MSVISHQFGSSDQIMEEDYANQFQLSNDPNSTELDCTSQFVSTQFETFAQVPRAQVIQSSQPLFPHSPSSSCDSPNAHMLHTIRGPPTQSPPCNITQRLDPSTPRTMPNPSPNHSPFPEFNHPIWQHQQQNFQMPQQISDYSSTLLQQQQQQQQQQYQSPLQQQQLQYQSTTLYENSDQYYQEQQQLQQQNNSVIERLRGQVQELQLQNNELNRRLRNSTQRCEQLSQQAVDVELREQNLSDELKKCQGEVRILQNQLENSKSRLNVMEDGRRVWEEQSRHQQHGIEEIQRDVILWKDRATKAEKQLEMDKKKIDSAIGDQNRMEDELLQYKRRHTELSSEVSRLQRDNDVLRKVQNEGDNKQDDLSMRLSRFQKQAEQFQMENEELQKDCERVERERDSYYESAVEMQQELQVERQRYDRLKEELLEYKALRDRVEQARNARILEDTNYGSFLSEDEQPYIRPPTRSKSPSRSKSPRNLFTKKSPVKRNIMSATNQRSLSPRTREKFLDDSEIEYRQKILQDSRARPISPYAEDNSLNAFSPMENAPYGNAAALTVMQKVSKQLEDDLLQLNLQKADLVNEYSKMPAHGCRTVKMKERKAEVEDMLDKLDKSISKVKRELRNKKF